MWTLFIVFILLTNFDKSLTENECFAKTKSRSIEVIEENADLYLGTLFNFRSSGPKGIYGCGNVTEEGLITIEALKWITLIINQGQINNKQIVDSFIPGIKLGIKLYDTCEHQELGIKYLTQMFPEIEDDKSTCIISTIGNAQSSPLGILDSTNVHLNPKIDQILKTNYIPIASLNANTFISTETIVKTLMKIIKYAQWTQFSIVYTYEEKSINIVKQLGQLSMDNKICLISVKPFPVTSKIGVDKTSQIKTFNTLLYSVTSKLPLNSPIIIIGSGHPVNQFVEVIKKNENLVSKFQWLFLSLPNKKIITSLDFMIDKIFTLLPYPGIINDFENFWKLEQSVNQSNNWFNLLIKNCNKPECFQNSELSVLWRTHQLMPIIHSIFTFAYAIRNAWIDTCNGVRGLCKSLQSMTRKKFVSNFLENLNFEYNPSLLSPFELKGRKNRSLRSNGNEDIIKLALTTFTMTSTQVIKPIQIVAYSSLNDESLILNKNHLIISSLCPLDGCKKCIKIRQSRFEEPVQETEKDNSIFDEPNFTMISEDSTNIIIPLIFEIHKKGNSEFECSEDLNLPAIYDLEAALYALDQLNKDKSRGINYGLLVIDSCSSILRLTHKLLNFFNLKVNSATISVQDTLSFISSIPIDQSESLIELLKPLNISLISIKDLTLLERPMGADHHLFQTTIPYKILIEAAIEQIKYFGWKYLSLMILKDDKLSDNIIKLFINQIKEAGICIATIANLEKNDLLSSTQNSLIKLKHAKTTGAKVVVILGNTASIRAFMTTYKKFTEAGSLKKNEFVWLLISESNLNIVDGLEQEFLGTLVIHESQSNIKSFIDHFSSLSLETNKRNPWFSKFLKQNANCQAHDCNTKLLNPISAVNTMHSLASLIISFNQLRDEICGLKKKGLCDQLLFAPNLRKLISKYIQSTTINVKTGIKNDKEKFSYTKGGFSSKAVDILNFKSNPKNKNFFFEQVAVYNKSKFKKLDSSNYSFYDDNKEVSMNAIKSDCLIPKVCIEKCPKNDFNYLIVKSPSNFYVAAAIAIHKPSALNLFQCGSIDYQGVQLSEAFLWAIDYINNQAQILPNIKLGAIIIDTCSSYLKASRDISNVLSSYSESDWLNPYLHHSKKILTLIINSNKVKMMDTVLDITLPLKLITLASSASNSKYDQLDVYSQLIRFSVSNQVYSDALVSLLMYFQWTYVSVVSNDEEEFLENIFQDFKSKTKLAGIEIGVQEKMNNFYNPSSIRLTLLRLNEGAKFGAKIVIMCITNDQLSSLLNEAKVMQDSNQINWKQFLVIGIESREAFQKYPELSLSALSIMKPLETVPNFKDYFVNLNIRNNSRNPWFKEYWQSTNNCLDSTCFAKLDTNLSNQSYINDQNIASIINSVFTFAKGLSAAQRTLCPTQSQKNCFKVQIMSKLSEILSDFIRSSVFISGSGKTVKFLENSNYVLENLNILKFQYVSYNTFAFLKVGRFNEKDGLLLNKTIGQAHEGLDIEKELKQFMSKCQNHSNCLPKAIQLSPADSNILSITEFPASNRFMIGAFFSIHKRGSSLFRCGEIDVESTFQNFIAFNYALEIVNSNKSLDDIKFDGFVIDSCGRKERAKEKLLKYFSEKNMEDNKVLAKHLVAMISYSQEISQDIDSILKLHQITHLTISSKKLQANYNLENEYELKAISTIPERSAMFEALLDLIKQLGWTYIHVVYNNLKDRNNFVLAATARRICIAKEFDFSSTHNNLTTMIDILKGNLSQSQEAQVVVNLLDDALNNILFTSTFQEVIKKFVWVGDESMFNRLVLNRVIAIALFLKVESYTEKEFQKYMSSLSLKRYSSIPLNWFKEFWQSYFKCRLPNTVSSNTRFIKICSGKEKIEPVKFIKNEFVHHTITSVKTIATVVNNYIKLKCKNKNIFSSIYECYKSIKYDLDQEIKKSLIKTKKHGYPNNQTSVFGFHVILSFSYKSFINVGLWRNGLLQLFSESSIRDSIGSDFISTCIKECSKCDRQINSAQLTTKSKLIYNRSQFWIILAMILSGLGVLFVIICTTYFSMIFSISFGTTILGYFILLGLLLIYLVNFVLLAPITYTICCLQKVGMSLSYTIIISGMLVKVLNTWRLMAYKSIRAKELKLTCSSGLLFISLGLVAFQLIITLIWLKIFPPIIEFNNEQWTCSPVFVNSFIERESIVSLIYVILLLFITMFFAMLTWKCTDNNQESRYIFFCCFGVAIIWICWAIMKVYLQNFKINNNLNIIFANLLSATLIMITLYARKLRIYRKLIKRDRSLKARFDSSFSQSFYGSVYKSKSTFNPVIWGHQLDFYGNINLSSRTATRAPFENDVLDDGVSSCGSTTGSVQVHGEDLYPMEVYDNGNQFKSLNRFFSSNSTKSLYIMDDSTFIK